MSSVKIVHEKSPGSPAVTLGELHVGEMFRLRDDRNDPDPCMVVETAPKGKIRYWDFLDEELETADASEPVVRINCVLTYTGDDEGASK